MIGSHWNFVAPLLDGCWLLEVRGDCGCVAAARACDGVLFGGVGTQAQEHSFSGVRP